VTPPLATDARVMAPPPGVDAGAQGAVGDVGASTSSPVIDVDPISAVPGGADEDLVKDQMHLEQAPKGAGSSGA
jgi:hypothetical protein